MIRVLSNGIVLGIALWLVSCSASRLYVADSLRDWDRAEQPGPNEEVYRVFLIGDAGAVPANETNPVLTSLRRHLQAVGRQGAVVFLGDNLYCCGLPDSSDPARAEAEGRLTDMLEAVDDFPGRVVFIPGNHDWNSSEPGGLEAVRRQERFVESFLDRGDTFLPSDGFPGPAKLDLTDEVTLLAVDTEWYLTDQSKPFGDDGDHDIEHRNDLLIEINEEVQKEHDKHLIVVGHHPLMSNGTHAGNVPAREHLFPLTALSDKAYVPLPIIGSLSVMYRRYLGLSEQDLPHPRYRAMTAALTHIFRPHESLVYASGHEHNFQFFRFGNERHPNHFVVSGAGSKTSYVGAGGDALFTGHGRGFATLHYYEDGSSWLSFWRVDPDLETDELLFRTRLKGPRPPEEPRELPLAAIADYPDYRDSVRVTALNPTYLAGPVKTFFLGSHNRDTWAEPVKAPYLDMGREAGGLVPIKRGGGMQTTSLRLRGGDGKQYVLRSLDKDPVGSLPAEVRETFAAEIIRDQTASINPYGAFAVPALAAAGGIYHTKPRIVYVPRDDRLGPYLDTFADRVMMLEVRPDDDMSDSENFGNSKDVVSARKLHQEINGDNDNSVDQEAYARARLLDMLMSDWDRHRDQWRWASFKKKDAKGKLYRPIPRDRDWAFNRLNGLIPPIVRYFNPKFQDFRYTYGSLKGLNTSGLEQDRRFASELRLEDWSRLASDLRDSLPDSVIDAAVSQMPESIVRLKGDEMASKLKVRRDKLPEAAEEYYLAIARIADVVGSNKHERFEVSTTGPDLTQVVVYKTSKSGEIREQLYRRVFSGSETDEIRLYGLDGNDTFVLDETGGGLKVRCVGGPGTDRFEGTDQARDVMIHDTKSGNEIGVGRNVRLRLTDDPWLNSYDPREFRHDMVFPQVFFGANADDGVFLGGGARFVKHGFKKAPYSAAHRIVANFAARTAAFNIDYRGHFVGALARRDLHVDVEILSPNSIRNFYGLGNETDNSEGDRTYYQARLTQVNFNALVGLVNLDGLDVRTGPTLRVTDVRQDADRRGVIPQPGLSETTFDDQWFGGVRFAAELENLDRQQNPRRGFRWSNTADVNLGIRNSSSNYAKLLTDLVVFASPSVQPQITIGARIGAEHNVGSFPFYDASTLGGRSNLRGFRSTRYAGRTAFFQNLELRARLFRFSTYVAAGDAGLLAFVDNGRVWTDEESSSVWHQGYGGGYWATLFETATLGTWIATSSDDLTFTLQLGFQY